MASNLGLLLAPLAKEATVAAMRIEQPIIEGRLEKRYKRFLADVRLEDGELLTAHCANTGSMLGCSDPGSRVLLRDSQNPARKLRHTLHAVEADGTWISVEPTLSNTLVHELLEARRVPGFEGYESFRPEVRYGEKSRIDWLLEGEGLPACYLEVKTTTLATSGVAAFPDAVTTRGQKHLQELAQVVREGHRGVIFFAIARDDVETFRPADEIDPDYGRLLRAAIAEGVEALAWTTRVEPGRLELVRPIRIDLGTPHGEAIRV